ncbi:serine hydrolase [Mycobacterium paraterrae]|uniref:Class A beta-lactamase-related serine hydrolase n=1 Tax=Mycobacterium paraterrae TaxID=577492 RepID=A0ABY3VJ53_9MYCO|nr:serine hydrolase [Mycobacterium paraterrae]UMB69444.1 class A beta-lactamase-related serine hydrolase [Mycobacterium paraterrae]
MLQSSIDEALSTRAGIDWAVSIRDAAGHEIACWSGDHALKTASVGKLLLLVEVARQRVTGELDGTGVLTRKPELTVADSGIWQHLHVDELAIDDLCVLIASVSDNTATNVLLERVGLHRVVELARSLGLTHTALLDFVRDDRGPNHPATLSTGSASELSGVMSRLSRGALISTAVSEQVNAWLATGVDLSMVASAWGLDPLAHTSPDRNTFLSNKTGSDPGVRADVGFVARGAACFSYAVIANWDAGRDDIRDTVLSGMNAVGTVLRAALEGE